MNIYDEIPTENFIRFLKYHSWYQREEDDQVWSLLKVIPKVESVSFHISNSEEWKNEAIQTIAKAHNRSMISIAGEIADFNDTPWRMVNIRNKGVLERIIPKGDYCYDENGCCPFLSVNEEMPKQMGGYCHYLQKGDWQQNGTTLLWDQCKQCGINEHHE